MNAQEVIDALIAHRERLIGEVWEAFEERGSRFGRERFAAWRKRFSRFLDETLPGESEKLDSKLSHSAFVLIRGESDAQQFWRMDGDGAVAFIDSLIMDVRSGEYEFDEEPAAKAVPVAGQKQSVPMTKGRIGTKVEEGTIAEIDVFISHSSRDEEVARLLITLIRSSLNLPSERIRCTSVDGFRLPAGTSTDEVLRQEIHQSKVFIAIVTPDSIASTYVLLEMGARWGSQKPMIPLLASGAGKAHLKGPLSAINALSCDEPAQLHQFVEELSAFLATPLDKAAAYEKCIREVVARSMQR